MLNLHNDNLNLDKVSQLIFDNATLIIYTWDLEGKITSFNPYGQEVTGYKSEEVIGQSWMDIFLEDEERDKVPGLINYVKTGRTLKHIIGNIWTTKNGDIIELIWTSPPVFNDEGNVIELISFGTDITQHKTLVKKLNDLAYYDDLTKLPNRKLAEEEINKLLIEYNISPREIILEITETALLSKRIIQSKVLKRLIDRGLEIALDDFGTGYSSLARINNLPLKHLKIDKCFIDNIEKATSEEALVKYIIDLGCALDLNVVAEGVETKGQMELLKKLGCHLAQGYYYAKPMPAHELDQKFLLPKEGI